MEAVTLSPFAQGVAWTVGAMLLVVAVSGLSRRIGWSAPLVLVVVGVIAAFVPGVPEFRLSPDVVLVGVLPALLFAAALQTSFLEVRARIDSVLLLSVFLVVLTALAVGFTAWLLLPGLGFAVAFALGAVVAPTDAVSVGALAGTGRLPRGLARLLESEGLLNDATALVLLNTALNALSQQPTPGYVAVQFLIAVVGGVGGGVLVGWLLTRVRRRLKAPVLDTSVSLASPYVAYLPATVLGGSGFLAVALAGIWLGYRAPSFQNAESRIAERINWRTVSFLLENGVFLLIGLQLPSIVRSAVRVTAVEPLQGALVIAGVFVAMVLARFFWVFLATFVYRVGPEPLRDRRWGWATAFAISFSGVRGVVTLAAAFTITSTETRYAGFVQLVAFVIVVLTLVQGIAIAPLVRRLRLPLPNPEQDRVQIRELVAEAQDAAVERLDRETLDDDPPELIASLRQSSEYRRLIAETDENGMANRPDSYARLRLLMLDSERTAVLQARHEGRYEDSVVDAVLGDFDSIETALKRSRRRDLPKAVRSRTRLTRPSRRA